MEDGAVNYISLQLQTTNGSRDCGQKNSAIETRGARNKETFTLLVGSYREPLTQMPSWERGGKRGDLKDQALDPKGLLKLLNQQKDGHQHV